MPPSLLFSGSANPALAEAVARQLGTTLSPSTTERFPDGELTVRLEASVRGRVVVVVQPTSPPVNDHLMELLAFADACRHAAAERLVAVVPYFGYARSDRRAGRREPIMARLAADLMQTAGIGHLVTLDAHTAQLEGFFRIPADNLSAVPALADALRDRVPADLVVVAPDLGAVDRATAVASRLGATVAVLHKQRLSGRDVAIRRIVGEVEGRPCLIVDDMISTGSTILKSAEALREAGAEGEMVVAATHGVFSGDALERLRGSGITDLWITDSIATRPHPGLEVVPIAPVLAAGVRRLTNAGGGQTGR
jgi:ribose-phosphate pyrophosphokinase